MEVATQEVLPAAVAARELAEARAAEAKAREQLAGLQLQLQGASLQATAEAAQQRAAAAAAQLDAALEEAARLKAEAGGLQRQLALVQQQVADLQVRAELANRERTAASAAGWGERLGRGHWELARLGRRCRHGILPALLVATSQPCVSVCPPPFLPYQGD